MQLWQAAGTDVQPEPCWHNADVHPTLLMQVFVPMHVMSQAHELPHEMLSWHEPDALHMMSHGPGPHISERHELWPVHSIVHDAAFVQSIPLWQALSTLHWKSQW